MASKRALSEVENVDVSPASKRQAIEPKSPKTATRDASEALIEAIKKAEEASLRAVKSATKRPKKLAVKIDKNTEWIFEKDWETGAPCIYMVFEKHIGKHADLPNEILGTFCTLTDANNFSRSHCAIFAERDDPKANFCEVMNLEGCIWWEFEDEKGEGRKVRIERCQIRPPGSVPVEDWGRPIGEPCLSRHNSEDS